MRILYLDKKSQLILHYSNAYPIEQYDVDVFIDLQQSGVSLYIID